MQPLWPASLKKPDLFRFRYSSGHVLSKTKSVTPQFFCISDITNSSSFNGEIFRKKSLLANFRANILKCSVIRGKNHLRCSSWKFHGSKYSLLLLSICPFLSFWKRQILLASHQNRTLICNFKLKNNLDFKWSSNKKNNIEIKNIS